MKYSSWLITSRVNHTDRGVEGADLCSQLFSEYHLVCIWKMILISKLGRS